jgi:hypothetical protein
MSRLQKLLAKPVEVEIQGDKYSVSPLALEHLDIVVDLQKEEKRGKAMQRLMELSLKQSVPDATPDEIRRLPLEFVAEYMKAVLKVNGLDASDERIQAIIEAQEAAKRPSPPPAS